MLSLFEDAPDGVFLFYDRLIALQSEEAVLDESSGSSEESGEVKLHSPFVTVTKKPLPTSRKPRD